MNTKKSTTVEAAVAVTATATEVPPIQYIYNMSETDIQHTIISQLPIKIKEKQLFGEVFTHPTLIHQMLDLFPTHVWSNPEIHWNDPCGGIGIFLICIYQRLMVGLKPWEPNSATRSRHITNNMLYMCELNPINWEIANTLFDTNHITCADFLTIDNNTYSNIHCFVGNPPFQIQGRSYGKNKIYEKIISKCTDILIHNNTQKTQRHICFLSPDNLFSGTCTVGYNTLTTFMHVGFVSFNQLELHKYFSKIQQPICLFFASTTNSGNRNGNSNDGQPQTLTLTTDKIEETTTVEINGGERNQFILQARPVNPVRNWTPAIEKLVEKYVTDNRNTVKYNRGKNIGNYSTSDGTYALIYGPKKILYTDDILLAPGYGIVKVIIFAISPKLEHRVDATGEFGVGPNTFYIPLGSKKECDTVSKFLSSEIYRNMSRAINTTRQYIKMGFVEYLNIELILAQPSP